MSNQWCDTCGGLVDRIGLRPQGVRFCECRETIEKLRAKLAALRAENEALRDVCSRLASYNAEESAHLRTRLEKAEAELAALRADAERYRWLRDKYTVSLLNGEHELRITYGPRASSKSGIDDIIDAARGGHMTRPRGEISANHPEKGKPGEPYLEGEGRSLDSREVTQ